MAIFEKLPYTNYHNLNADWIVKKVKEVADAWTEYRDDMDDWKAGVDTELQTFYDWFDNLDLTDDVRTIIEEMVQDGSFMTAATPVITSATETWLAAHVSQGYAVDNTLTISGAAADAKVAGDGITQLKEDLAEKANIDGYYEGMTVGNAEQLLSSLYALDSEPYIFRASGGSIDIGNREYDEVVGSTVAWNQLFQRSIGQSTVLGITVATDSDGVVTFSGTATNSGAATLVSTPVKNVNGHVYLLKSNASNQAFGFSSQSFGSTAGRDATVIRNTSPNEIWYYTFTQPADTIGGETTYNNVTMKPMVIDLTQLLGATIADYIYSLETAEAGAGVSYFRKLFPLDYYEYNAGELMHVSGVSSHDTVGFNQWDEEWEVGAINTTTGENVSASTTIRSKNYIPVFPNTTYNKQASTNILQFYYDSNKSFIGYGQWGVGTFTTPSNCAYIRFYMYNYGTTYNNDICINLSWSGYRNGEYEPYVKHSYPLDSSLTLRGIPKLSDGNVYYDGDTYADDGTVTRRYGIVDLGTLDWYYVAPNTGYPNGAFYASLANKKHNSINCISSKYISSLVYGGDGVDKVVSINSDNNYCYVVDSAYTDAAAFKTAMSGVYLVYELATPTTEEAEPYQNPQIVDDFGTEEYVTTSIVPVGHNTKYPENLKAKIEGLPWNFATLIAPTETTYTATRNYTTGQLFIVANVLYKATANIANGGAITPNTNCTATTLAEVISAL